MVHCRKGSFNRSNSTDEHELRYTLSVLPAVDIQTSVLERYYVTLVQGKSNRTIYVFAVDPSSNIANAVS